MRLFLLLAFLFIALPWIEISLLIYVGNELGFFSALVIVLITGCVGAALARRQGIQVWGNVRRAARQGKVPSKELFDGFCILCAGLLLVTPGLLTDCTGFLLLFPPFRAVVRKALARRLMGQAVVSGNGFSFSAGKGQPPSFPQDQQQNDHSDVIDVEAEVVDDK